MAVGSVSQGSARTRNPGLKACYPFGIEFGNVKTLVASREVRSAGAVYLVGLIRIHPGSER